MLTNIHSAHSTTQCPTRSSQNTIALSNDQNYSHKHVGLEVTHQATNVAPNITQTNPIKQMAPASNQNQRQLFKGKLAYTKSDYTHYNLTKQ